MTIQFPGRSYNPPDEATIPPKNAAIPPKKPIHPLKTPEKPPPPALKQNKNTGFCATMKYNAFKV